MDTSRKAIETWLLLDGCRLPPRVFAIIDELLEVIERQERVLTRYRAMLQPDQGSLHGVQRMHGAASGNDGECWRGQ